MSGSGYKITSMAEIKAIPWNGFNVVSTFSGGGGSCLGYRMAGYKVRWANEFVPAAQDTYRANFPDTFLNCQNVREITGAQILDEAGIDEVDLFDGSPPCASFSTAGSREKHWGEVKAYSDTKERVDDLFFEYTRLISELRPKVFVAENVSGLVKGTAKGVFKMILREMKACGYHVSARLLNAKWLGVPQSRERLIFVGVRDDLCERYGVEPTHPKPENRVYTLSDAFAGLENDEEQAAWLEEEMGRYRIGEVLKMLPKDPPKVTSASTVMNGSYFSLVRESMHEPCGTIQQRHGALNVAGTCHPLYDRKFTIPELRRITSLPDDFELTGTFEQQWERCGRMVPPVMMSKVAKTIEKEILCKIR